MLPATSCGEDTTRNKSRDARIAKETGERLIAAAWPRYSGVSRSKCFSPVAGNTGVVAAVTTSNIGSMMPPTFSNSGSGRHISAANEGGCVQFCKPWHALQHCHAW